MARTGTGRSASVGYIRQPATSTPGWGGSGGYTGQIQLDAQNNYFVTEQFLNIFTSKDTHQAPWHYHHHVNE